MDKSIKKSFDFNRLQIEQELYNHQMRVSSAKSTIVNKQPTSHSVNNLKKEQVFQLKQREIQKDNNGLLNRLSDIIQRKCKIDLSNHYRIKQHRQKVSEVLRQQRNEQIALENQNILSRIQNQKPIININKFEKDRQKQETLLRNRCAYPFQFSVKNLNLQSPSHHKRNKSESHQLLYRRLDVINFNSEKLEKRNIIYKQGMKLNTGDYIVELSENQSSMFLVAYKVTTTGAHALEIPINQGNQLLEDFKHNYQNLFKKLKIVNNNLILTLPLIQRWRNKSEKCFFKDSDHISEFHSQISFTLIYFSFHCSIFTPHFSISFFLNQSIYKFILNGLQYFLPLKQIKAKIQQLKSRQKYSNVKRMVTLIIEQYEQYQLAKHQNTIKNLYDRANNNFSQIRLTEISFNLAIES